MLPLNAEFSVWEVLAYFRISMRNLELASSTRIDGGCSCLSGRTAAYRTKILLDPLFQKNFVNEFWLGKYHQHSGDDKFLTRWMYANDWGTYVQCHPGAMIGSFFKDNWKFLKQLLRWTRNTWRSDFRSLFVEKKIWLYHPYTAFTMFDKMFNVITLLLGPALISYLLLATVQDIPVILIITSYFMYLLLTRFLVCTFDINSLEIRLALWRPAF